MISSDLKISIVTPTFNQAKYIRETIESVLHQNYKNIEHIIVDGGSTDGTIDIIKEYGHLKWISEKDNGPASAINKGFGMATGEIFAWINSDDYYDKNIFYDIVCAFELNDIKLLSGDLTFVYPENNRLDKLKVKPYHINKLIHNSADSVRQASLFFRKDLFFNVAMLDESIKLVFDYDLIIKMMKITECYYLNKNLAFQRIYSETLTKSNLRLQACEIFKVSRKYGAKLYDVIMLKSVIRKLLFPNYF